MVKLTTTTFGLLSLASQILAAPTAAPTVKIMPFGASIVGAPGCWRALLWKELQDNNIKNTDFVGSNAAPDCGFPYDGENEGHAGSLATDYAKNGKLVQWLSAAKPDVVLMHVGTNDIVIGKKKPEEITAAYSTLVNQMRASKPQMQILISKLIPLASRFGADAQNTLKDLNTKMDQWARNLNKQNPDKPAIVIMDAFTNFNPDTDTVDGEHPNDNGNQKLRDVYYKPLATAIKNVR